MPASAKCSIRYFTRKYGVPCLIGFIVLNGFIFWSLRRPIFQGYGDFAAFYPAGEIVRNGESRRLYDLALQWKLQQQFASSVRIRLGPLPYIRPPFEALLFVPFVFWSYPVACALWTGMKIVLLLIVAKILPEIRTPRIRGSTYSFTVLMFFSFFPVAFDLVQGQDAVLVLLIVVVALKLLLRGADFKCGAMLALGLFKFHLLIPLLAIFVLRKRGKLALGFASVAAVLLAMSWRMVGWSGFWFYPRYLWRLNQVPGLGMVKVQSMPNIRGLLSAALRNGSFPVAAHWFLGAMVLLGIFIGSRAWRGDDRDSVIGAFCFAIVITLATSYYANSYDLTLLLLPLLLLGDDFLSGTEITGWPRMVFLASAAGLLFSPLMWALAMKTEQFRFVGVFVIGLAVAVWNAGNSGRREARG